jgi:hypothetical protein
MPCPSHPPWLEVSHLTLRKVETFCSSCFLFCSWFV